MPAEERITVALMHLGQAKLELERLQRDNAVSLYVEDVIVRTGRSILELTQMKKSLEVSNGNRSTRSTG